MAPFLFLVALAAQTAVPPDWHSIGLSGNGRQTWYDPASVVREGAVTRVRVRFAGDNNYALSVVELRCAAFEARVVGVVTYNADGTEANRSTIATPFRAIMGSGFLVTLAREVCGAAQGPSAPE